MDCLICKIVNGEIPSKKIYEDENCYAFEDINPVAPVHVLIVPKKHIDGVDTIEASDGEILKSIFAAIKIIAKDLKLNNGYRVISNVAEDGGQSVRHLHFHLIGGKKLAWTF